MAKILVIDDDSGLRTLYEKRLQMAGHDVIIASNGTQGLQRALDEHPDLIVLDLAMPGMNGVEVLKHLRDNPDVQDTKVIVVTASTWDVVHGAETADMLMYKPVSTLDLVGQINRLLAAPA